VIPKEGEVISDNVYVSTFIHNETSGESYWVMYDGEGMGKETVVTLGMDVYLCVHKYVCICIYMYIYMYDGEGMGKETVVTLGMDVHLCTYTYICIYICICMMGKEWKKKQ
jgi:hypothetical protein